MWLIDKIVSGGQTGADRAALGWAIENGIPHGGWCPQGRLAEDGPISTRYNLTESPSKNYLQRTEWNARDSDGTVVFSIAPILSGGSLKTVSFAQKHKKPVIHISRENQNPGESLIRFIRSNDIRILNVAGPRCSKEPEVGEFVKLVLGACRNEGAA
jgi:Circularly permutated YpsA SLOG family